MKKILCIVLALVTVFVCVFSVLAAPEMTSFCIRDNEGNLIWSADEITYTFEIIVNEDGLYCNTTDTTWIYEGEGTFLGFADVANAAVPTYTIGNTYTIEGSISGTNLYIVEKSPVTFDLSTLDLSAGEHTITVKAKADGYKTSEASESLSYIVSASLITFSIEGTEYTAEEGMTWREWVESDYNTGGYEVIYLSSPIGEQWGVAYGGDGACAVLSSSYYPTPDEVIDPTDNYTLSEFGGPI